MTASPLVADRSAPTPPRRHHPASLSKEVLVHTSNTDTPQSAVRYAKKTHWTETVKYDPVHILLLEKAGLEQ